MLPRDGFIMDQNELNILWKTVLGEIQTEVSQANFLTLLKPTNLLSLTDNTATIATSSNIAIDLLQKRFLPMIKKSLDKHLKNDVKILFVPKIINSIKAKEKNGPLFVNQENTLPEPEPQPKNNLIKNLFRVRTDFTFQTMAVSSSNQLAFVSAQTVAKNLGRSYNPLFIYGPVGVGKTHLMQAIANEVFQKDPARKIIYITSEEFTNDVVEAIRSNDTARMKKKFRTADLLIIDDVQFIAGKDRVQEELFHTFNILIDNSSQIVLSSDRPPSEIKKLEKRLSSRFSAGLTVDIEQPDFELRTAILLIKARKLNIELPIESAKIMAEKVQDVRSLEGVLLRVITEAESLKSSINSDLVLKILEGKQAAQRNILHPDEVIKIICSYYNIKPTLIKSPKRESSLVRIRQITMYLLKKEFGLTFVEIGNLLGGRDHTTIMHGVEKVERIMPDEVKMSSEIVGIMGILSGQKVNY
ncbi:chromosomal replication initiator protein DnaA [Candidatus Microgenomates bacterium]|nr:MAG: chromosomal replication initiator protein DnaA [Candidatus Microgenomates bacterium]